MVRRNKKSGHLPLITFTREGCPDNVPNVIYHIRPSDRLTDHDIFTIDKSYSSTFQTKRRKGETKVSYEVWQVTERTKG